jgi:hypothetical protein
VGASPPQELGNFLGIDTIVFGCAAMDGLHGERVPEDESDPFPRTQVSQPRPREETCDRDDKSVTRGGNDLKEGLGVSVVVVMDQALPVVVHDTDVHRPGMQIDATVRLMLFGVESHEVSSSPRWLFPPPAYHGGMLRRGPQ